MDRSRIIFTKKLINNLKKYQIMKNLSKKLNRNKHKMTIDNAAYHLAIKNSIIVGAVALNKHHDFQEKLDYDWLVSCEIAGHGSTQFCEAGFVEFKIFGERILVKKY